MVIHACRPALALVLRKGIGSHSHNRHGHGISLVGSPDSLCRFITIHNRHPDIHQNHIKIACVPAQVHLQAFPAIMSHKALRPVILQQEGGDFQVHFIVVHHQNPLACQNILVIIFFFPLAFHQLRCQLHRSIYLEGTSLSQLAFYLYFAAHKLHNFLDNRHSQPCARHLFLGALPGKWCKQPIFQKILAHAHARILHSQDEHCLPGLALNRLLCHIYRHRATLAVVLQGIGQDVGGNALDVHRAAKNISVLCLKSLVNHFHIIFPGYGLHSRQQAFHHFFQIPVLPEQLNLAAFNLAHIKHIINQHVQLMAGGLDFLQCLPDTFLVIQAFHGNIRHADNPVHRGAHIMAHAAEEIRLCLAGPFGLLQRLQQMGVGLLQLPLVLLFLPFFLINALPAKQQGDSIRKGISLNHHDIQPYPAHIGSIILQLHGVLVPELDLEIFYPQSIPQHILIFTGCTANHNIDGLFHRQCAVPPHKRMTIQLHHRCYLVQQQIQAPCSKKHLANGPHHIYFLLQGLIQRLSPRQSLTQACPHIVHINTPILHDNTTGHNHSPKTLVYSLNPSISASVSL